MAKTLVKKLHKSKASKSEIAPGSTIVVNDPICQASNNDALQLTNDWNDVTCKRCLARRPKGKSK